MNLGLSDSLIILSWAVSTLLGWTITFLGYYIPLFPKTVLLIWAALLIFPISATTLKYWRGSSNKAFNAWALIMALILFENFFVSVSQIFSYFVLWSLSVAAVFYYTSQRIPQPSKKTYFYAALANLAVVSVPYLIPLEFAAVILGLTQSIPVFYDWHKVHN